MCTEAVGKNPYTLDYVPDHFITQKMCNEAMCKYPAIFFIVPDRFKTQEIYIKAVEVDPWQLDDVPDHFKAQGMCNRAAKDSFFSLLYVPDWCVTQQEAKLLHDDGDCYDDHELIEWYEGYIKGKTQKAQIKEELIPIA